MTLFDIINMGVDVCEDDPALVCDNDRYTYGEFFSIIKSRAQVFKKNGIGRNHKVALIIEDPLEFVFDFFAVSYINGVVMPIYPQTGDSKIYNIVKKYDINFVLSDDGGRRFGPSGVGLSMMKKTFIYSFQGDEDTDLEDVGLIMFTSGTTSTPKAIMLTEKNILSNIVSISDYLELCSLDKVLVIKGLCHSSSIIGELMVSLYNGCSVYLTRKLPATVNIMRMITDNRISAFFAVPTILKDIMTRNDLDRYDIRSLRIVNFYGAPMNHNDILSLIEIMPDCNIIYSYGQTEASPRVTYILKEDLKKKPKSCGQAVRHVQIGIIGEKQEILQPGQIGQIIVKGPNVMKGYYRDISRTANTVINGWLHTGDVGYIDEGGYLYVTGRKDNLIISAGKNIYPEEIESVIMSFDLVKEAIVLNRQNDNGTSNLTVYVVLKNDDTLDRWKLLKYCQDNLENYKIPQNIIIVNELEKNMNGKMLRNALLDKEEAV